MTFAPLWEQRKLFISVTCNLEYAMHAGNITFIKEQMTDGTQSWKFLLAGTKEI